MTAALNCSSTNQGFISFSKKIEEKKKKPAQLLCNCSRVDYVEANPDERLLGFSLPSFKSSVDVCVCIIRVPVNLFLHLFVQSLDREIWKCDSSDRAWSHRLWHSRTEAQPPAQALGHGPHNTAARSHPWQGFVARQSHFFMSSYSTMTGLGTLVPNLRVSGSQLFQSSPSHLKPPRASSCTRLKLLHWRWSGLWSTKALEEFLHSSSQQPCPHTPHILRANTENPQRKYNFPLLKGNGGEGRSNKPSISLQTRLCRLHTWLKLSVLGCSVAWVTTPLGAAHVPWQHTDAHLHHCQDRGAPGSPQGPNSASRVLTKYQQRNPPRNMVPVNTGWHINITKAKTGGKTTWACAGAKEGKNRLAPHAHL